MCQEITKKILDLLSPKSDNLPKLLYWKPPHSTVTTPQYSSSSTVYSLVMNRLLRKKTPTTRNEDFFMGLTLLYIYIYIYRVSHELRSLLRESVPYVKVYRYNPKHLCPKLNGYGDNGQRKVWASGVSTYCTSSVMP